MQKKIYLLGLVLSGTILISLNSCKTERPESAKERKAENKYDDIKSAMDYEFNMLKNPATGKIPENIHVREIQQAREILEHQDASPLLNNSYIFEGPNNLGGRTRAIVFDTRFNGSTNRVIMAGGVSGGIYKSADNGTTWVRKSATSDHFSVTSIAQDKRAGFQDTWYYSTGEAVGNSASASGALYGGNGVYKSTDNGETWTRLGASNPSPLESFTSVMDFITRVAVSPFDGAVYAAATGTIVRSTNGGTSWQVVMLGTPALASQFTDVAITSTGRVYIAFGGNNDNTVDGVWTSVSGAPGTYTRIAGGGSPAGWNANGAYGRVVLGIAPSNENLVYALYWNNYTSNCSAPAPEAELFLWDNAVSGWTDKSANLPNEPGCSQGNDPFTVQTGYDLVVAVKPDNPNIVFLGGTNIYRSTDAFSTNNNTTRIGGYSSAASTSIYANSHPDIHVIAFEPGNPSVLICGNDGGMQRTSNSLAPTVSWTPINNGYRTFQYYRVAVDPEPGSTKVMGGAQDNGTTRNSGSTGSPFTLIAGGDGVSVGLSKPWVDPFFGDVLTWEYMGSQQGTILTREQNTTPGFVFNITPNTASYTGLFVTLFHLDPDSTENLYYADNNTLYRTGAATGVTPANWTRITGFDAPVGAANDITALATTRGNYIPATSSLFAGTSNGKVFRYDDPINASPSAAPADISGAGFPAGTYVSSIAVNPRNDDTVIVTFSNYGVTSVFWTGNANAAIPSWQNAEGNLTLPSFRSSAIMIRNNIAEYYVGTSTGLYAATIDGTNPGATIWAQEGASSIGNAVVTSLALRPSDNKLVIGTHGYGMWSAIPSTTLPIRLLDFNGMLQQQTAMLHWSTSFESNSREFIVEKSKDGVSFYSIGSVQASGNSNYSRNYSYEDKNITGINYYRLKMVDLNGRSEYSKIIAIGNFRKELFSLFPNPASAVITIAGIQADGLITLTDMNGNHLKKIRSSGSSETIDISRLKSAAYIITYNYRNDRQLLQFIKK